MNSISRPILSTLALYAAEGRSALTLDEISAHLHKPLADTPPPKPTKEKLSRNLDDLIKNHLIFHQGGYFSLGEITQSAQENILKAKQSAEKIKKNKWPLIFLRAVPFALAIAVTGSVAMDNATEKSDLDLLIIVKEGRIWIARIFTLLIIEMFGRRRENPKTNEKICLNFFTARDTEVPIQNIAMANMLWRAIPLYGGNIFAEFINKNYWIKKFLYADNKTYATNKISFAAQLMEYCLNRRAGDRLEQFFKNWQYRRLVRKIATPQNLEHLILTDEILMLHYPDPKNKKVMEKYTRAISNLI